MRFDVPKKRVWELFMDVHKLASCMPDVEQIRMLDERSFETEMVVKVQFMTIRFMAKGEWLETVEEQSLDVQLTGKPVALAGLMTNRLRVELAEEGEQTIVRYRMQLHMTGRLASLGSILVRGTAEKSAQTFADNVRRTLTG